MGKNSSAWRRCWTAILVLFLAPVAEAAKSAPAPKVRVEGVSTLRNRELRVALNRLLSTETKDALDANAIEDGAVILSSSLGEEGFQEPKIRIELVLTDGTRKEFVFDPTFANPLPRPLAAKEVNFKVQPGVRYYIDTVAFDGLTVMSVRDARGFFRASATLVGNARTNAFSKSRLSRAADALLSELRQRGYADADVRPETKADPATGKVAVHVNIQEGPRWMIADLVYQRDEGDRVTLPPADRWKGQPWSLTLQEDIREAIRQAYYVEGFPDIGVHVALETDAAKGREKPAHVTATIVPGSRVKVGQVRFEGNVVTRENVMRRRVALNTGDLLNLVTLEKARYRLSRLGVFESVDLRFEPPDAPVRDPIFRVRESPRSETNLLMGWGSYEQLRAGVEYRQMNLFGLAHQSRLEVVQSMKSSSGEYTYAVPELFGESLDGSVRLFGLRREEIAFLREEWGIDAALKRTVPKIRGEASAGYTFQALRNRDNSLGTQATDDTQVLVASLNFSLKGDRRDNPLRPRHGYHWSARIEGAAPRYGGEATYQRFELAAAYHTRWSESRWLHFGLSNGLVTTWGADDSTLPVNKRFYPGGDNSIRGYQRGEAAPRGPDGLFIGAKSVLLGNVELEQAVSPNWSAVAFVDALAESPTLHDAPFEEKLYSVGLGVRFQTLIGPIRLEYGHNLNPRPGDPSGTLLFSIGYPF